VPFIRGNGQTLGQRLLDPGNRADSAGGEVEELDGRAPIGMLFRNEIDSLLDWRESEPPDGF